MQLQLTKDRFEIDEFYGLDKYPQTTAIFADNMLVFNYLAKYWIMNGSKLIGTSSTILTEYYEDYKDRVVQNGSAVVLEGEIPDGVPGLFMTEDKERADIISKMITDSYAEQRLGLVGLHTHDIVGERRRKLCWDDLPRTTWKSEQDEPVHHKGELLTDGSSSLIVGMKTAITQALAIREKSFRMKIIKFGEDVKELGSLYEYMELLSGDNIDNNLYLIIPNLYDLLRKYYRSKVIDNFTEEEFRSMLMEELNQKVNDKRRNFEEELVTIKGEGLAADFYQSKQRVLRHWKRQEIREIDLKVLRFTIDKSEGIHEGYPVLKMVGAEDALRKFLELIHKIYIERGISVTITIPTTGVKVTRKMRVFQKKVDGYQGKLEDLVLSMLDRCLFVFHDMGDLIVTDLRRVLIY